MEYALPKAPHERRSTVVLAQYWNQLRGDNQLPNEEHIDPDRLIGIWERCFLVQLRDINVVKDFNYSYYGEDLMAAYEDGRLQENNGHIPGENANQLKALYEYVISEAGPVMQENEYRDSVGRLVKYRQILMPFGKEDGTIESILGGVWFRLD